MPVGAPHIVCAGCGRATSLWAPLCGTCQSIADDFEIPPVQGERYRDVLIERAVDHEE